MSHKAAPRLVYVRLSEADRERLVRRALRNRRHPRDEGALIIIAALDADDEGGRDAE